MANKKRCIPISSRPVATKVDRMVAYDKEPLTKESHVLLSNNTLYVNFRETIPIQLEMVTAYEKASPPIMVT